MGSSYTTQVRPAPVGGVVRDVPTERVPLGAWLTANNAQFRGGVVSKVGGWRDTGNVAAGESSLVKAVRFATGEKSVLGTTTKLYEVAGDFSLSELGTFAMQTGERWRSDYLLGRGYFLGGTAGLWRWDGSDPIEEVDMGGFRARDFTQYENHLVLAKIISAMADGPLSLVGSSLIDPDAPDNPPLFDVTNVDSDAILLQVPSEGGPVQRAVRFGEWVAVYKESSIHLLSFIGGDSVYRLSERVGTAGLLAADGLARVRGAHVFVGQDDLYQWAGAAPEGFGRRVWTDWQADVKPLTRGLIVTFHNLIGKEVWLLYQSATGSGFDWALVWNYEYDAFSFREAPFVAVGLIRSPSVPVAEDTSPTYDDLDIAMDDMDFDFDTQIEGPAGALGDYKVAAVDAVGRVHELEAAGIEQGGSSDLVMELESGDTDFGYSRGPTTCGGLDLDVSGVTGANPLEVYVSARRSLGDAIQWRGPFPYDGTRGRLDLLSTDQWHRFRFVKRGGGCVLRGWHPRWMPRGER